MLTKSLTQTTTVTQYKIQQNNYLHTINTIVCDISVFLNYKQKQHFIITIICSYSRKITRQHSAIIIINLV